ncbi:sulfotransferase domain-containing protein [Myceligenerans salitolerans]|uniref:Sulfotransferase domain-containing protein n=1 Tax=Myceligenerans salitolerans TaxID=1230528 RepID=A0ABS3I6F9_9MICO|nr:sulfotransferase domain-containing protein [Myceligenerans salitolerans]MBO0608592.1 sulfotransferase domain-containing protein [Myceligenerans salitolerans]
MRLTSSALPRPVIDAGRATIRGYGMATSRLRGGPDFLLIGGKRAGSTSLYFALLDHPRVMPLFPSARWLPKDNHTKGVHYFDSHHDRGSAWYRSHFPASSRRGGKVVGEGSPYYLFHPLAAERAAREAPDARILLVVRDPVERAFSHYRERRREHAEPLETFEEALAAEAGRLAGEEERIVSDPGYRSYAHEQLSYRAQGEYAPHLRRWLKHYPAERVHVLVAEEFYADPQRACDGVAAFLGLDPAPLSAEARTPRNAAPSSTLLPATREELTRHYAPFNEELAQLLNRDLPW